MTGCRMPDGARRCRAGAAAIARVVGVVLPVHDEAALLPDCLGALRSAVDLAGVPVHVVVVLDRCTDASAAAVAAAGPLGVSTRVLATAGRNVGAARRAGCALLLAEHGSEGLWLATTDADSVVGASWLRRQLAYTAAGYDAVAGTVTIEDWTAYADPHREAYLRDYRNYWGHRHVHGANLGLWAEAYVAAGGFPPLSTGEDVALVDALLTLDRPIAWADDVPVVTSSRRQGRAPAGLSHLLGGLSGPIRPVFAEELDELHRHAARTSRPERRIGERDASAG